MQIYSTKWIFARFNFWQHHDFYTSDSGKRGPTVSRLLTMHQRWCESEFCAPVKTKLYIHLPSFILLIFGSINWNTERMSSIQYWNNSTNYDDISTFQTTFNEDMLQYLVSGILIIENRHAFDWSVSSHFPQH